MRFYTGTAFPAKYKNAIFMARHGSWKPVEQIGRRHRGRLLVADRDFSRWSRSSPASSRTQLCRTSGSTCCFTKDGAMLVSDDFNGAVYRITTERPHGEPLSK